MLHVKHRHVLVDGHLEPFRWRGLQQRFELLKIQVVARGDAFQAKLVFEKIRRQPVGHVQRIIADAPVAGEEFEVVVIADQIAVGVAGAHLLQRPFLARFEDARRRNPDGGARHSVRAVGGQMTARPT